MKSDDERNAQLLFQHQRHQPRHEKIGVNQLVRPVARTKLLHVPGKLLHRRQQVFLPHKLWRAGWYMNDPQAGPTLHNFSKQWMGTARKDVHLITEPNEVARDLGHVYILAAAVHAACRCQGRCVITDNSNSSEHDARPIEENTEALVGAQASACASFPYTQQKEIKPGRRKI